MAVEEEGSSPTSYAKRIERLERQYDTLNGTVNAMAIDVAVTRERVAGVDTGIGELKAQITAFILFSQKASTDPSATGAGQLLVAQIAAIRESKNEDHTAFLASIDKLGKSVSRIDLKIAYGAGALAALVFLLNLFAPALQRVLGLPS